MMENGLSAHSSGRRSTGNPSLTELERKSSAQTPAGSSLETAAQKLPSTSIDDGCEGLAAPPNHRTTRRSSRAPPSSNEQLSPRRTRRKSEQDTRQRHISLLKSERCTSARGRIQTSEGLEQKDSQPSDTNMRRKASSTSRRKTPTTDEAQDSFRQNEKTMRRKESSSRRRKQTIGKPKREGTRREDSTSGGRRDRSSSSPRQMQSSDKAEENSRQGDKCMHRKESSTRKKEQLQRQRSDKPEDDLSQSDCSLYRQESSARQREQRRAEVAARRSDRNLRRKESYTRRREERQGRARHKVGQNSGPGDRSKRKTESPLRKTEQPQDDSPQREQSYRGSRRAMEQCQTRTKEDPGGDYPQISIVSNEGERETRLQRQMEAKQQQFENDINDLVAATPDLVAATPGQSESSLEVPGAYAVDGRRESLMSTGVVSPHVVEKYTDMDVPDTYDVEHISHRFSSSSNDILAASEAVCAGQEDECNKDASRPARRKWLLLAAIVVVVVILVLVAVGVTVPLASKGDENSPNGPGEPPPPQFWEKLGRDLDGPLDFSFLGASVSLNAAGTILAAGAPGTTEIGQDAGQVLVYQYNNTTLSWERLGQAIRGAVPFESFGWSVSLNDDGDILAIGSSQSDNGTGHVQVYQFDTSSWVKQGQSIRGVATGDQCGYSVSLSGFGQRMAAGGPFNDENGSSAGHVRVFDYDTQLATWMQVGQDIVGGSNNDRIGFSVSLSGDKGDVIAIGANESDASAGNVRVYGYNPAVSTWTQMGADIDGLAAGDAFGFAVSISSDGLLVAASGPRGSHAEKSQCGYVRVHKYNAATRVWRQLGQTVYGENALDEFGYTVSLSGDGTQFVAGAPNNNGSGPASGHVRAFRYNTTNATWVQVGQDVDGESPTDSSGVSVALARNANVLATGAYANDGTSKQTNVGHVRVFGLKQEPQNVFRLAKATNH